MGPGKTDYDNDGNNMYLLVNINCPNIKFPIFINVIKFSVNDEVLHGSSVI